MLNPSFELVNTILVSAIVVRLAERLLQIPPIQLFVGHKKATNELHLLIACIGSIVKTKVENMIGSKLTPDNVLVMAAWRAYKTYAKET